MPVRAADLMPMTLISVSRPSEPTTIARRPPPLPAAEVSRPQRLRFYLDYVQRSHLNAADRKVVGAHILGHDAGEMAQLLGITLKAGCTKDDFDRTMAVHPTASEELVTMYQPSYRIRNGERV